MLGKAFYTLVTLHYLVPLRVTLCKIVAALGEACTAQAFDVDVITDQVTANLNTDIRDMALKFAAVSSCCSIVSSGA